jgi:Xaa-Pro aminopeptidase
MPDVRLTLHFSLDEYRARIARTRHAMQGSGIELLIVSDPSNMAWLTGYDGWSFYVHQCVLLALGGDPVWYRRGQDASGARRTAFMGDADIVGYPDHLVQSGVHHPMDYLTRVVAERGWDRLPIGVEMDNSHADEAPREPHRPDHPARRGRQAPWLPAPALQPGRFRLGLGDDTNHGDRQRRGADCAADGRQPR